MTFNPSEHLIQLKGKDYLQVMWRLVWFREEKPNWSIVTEEKEVTENSARFKAIIKDENERVIATSTGSETRKDFKDFIEKAETKAIGRALACLGYGTQFAPELDEGERIVDSPVKNEATEKTNKATDKQISAIYAISKEIYKEQKALDDFKKWVKKKYGTEINDLSKSSASELIELLSSKKEVK